MTRRKALIAMFVSVIALLSKKHVVKADDSLSWDDNTVSYDREPIDVMVEEGYLKNFIIGREDKPDIVIPFSEIIEALEKV